MDTSPLLITDLLDDCLFQIFKYIPYIAETIRLKRVCRKFYKAVTNYFSTHVIEIANNLHNPQFSFCNADVPLDKLFYNCPKLTFVRLTDPFCTVSNSVKKFEPFLNLVHFEVKYSSHRSKFKIQSFLKKCPNLENLSFITYLPNFPKRFNFNCVSNHLKYLTLTSINYQSFKNLLQSRGSTLITLDICYFEMSRVSQLNEIFSLMSQNCNNLQELRLGCIEKISFLNVPKMKWLRFFTSFSKQELSHELVEDMFKSMPALRTLDLNVTNCPSIEQIINYCSRYCLNIESLNARRSRLKFLSPEGLENWKSLKNLKTVNNRSFEYYERILRD